MNGLVHDHGLVEVLAPNIDISRPSAHGVARHQAPFTNLWGSFRIISLSLQVPGSLSSALITRNWGRPSEFLGMKDHFRPDGKPAPPRPRSPLSFISWTIQSGPIHRMSFVLCQSPLLRASTKRQSCSPYKFVKMRSWSARPPHDVFS